MKLILEVPRSKLDFEGDGLIVFGKFDFKIENYYLVWGRIRYLVGPNTPFEKWDERVEYIETDLFELVIKDDIDRSL